MNGEYRWEICEEQEEAYIIKIPIKQSEPIKLCVGGKLAAYLKEEGQLNVIREPAKYPIEIVNETCNDGKPVKKEFLDRFDFSVDRLGNHHFDVVYVRGVPYRIPLPHR